MEYIDKIKENKRVKIGKEDLKYKKKVVNKRERICREIRRVEKEKNAFNEKHFSAEELNIVIENEVQPSEMDPDFVVKEETKNRNKGRTLNLPKNPLEEGTISQMVDRLKLSANQTTGFLGAVIVASGGDLNQFSVSKTTTLKTRKNNREKKSTEIKLSFPAPQHCVLHWDSKILKIGDTTSDRLAILVSGSPNYEEGKLLAVPEIKDSTGSSTADCSLSLYCKGLGNL